jgi:hypothetical protein
MSEKKWSCKWRHAGHGGRKNHCDNSSQFPRQKINKYEGTHLGMCNRLGENIWRDNYAWLDKKYILGLLKKYVNQPFNNFKKVFDEKVKPIKHKLHSIDLGYYFENEETKSYWRPLYYIDDKGYLRKCPQVKRHRNRVTLTKRQLNYNKRVKVPNWGQVRTDPKLAVGSNSWYPWSKIMPPQYRQPLLLGEFYVRYNDEIVKLPVYTCNTDIFTSYYNYRDSEWDSKLQKYVKIPFWKAKWGYSQYSEKKRLLLTKEWAPVTVNGLDWTQDCWVRMKNVTFCDYQEKLKTYTNKLQDETDPIERRRIETEIEYYQERLEKTPEYATYNMGYGKYYTFIRKADYGKLKGES